MNHKNYIKGLVSVGIPTYNRPESLERAIKYIINQSYKNLEIIISDNNSPTNKVKNIVENYSKIDSRIKFYSQEKNTGVLANADFVLKKATGEFFTWFSDDDWRSPEFIESMLLILDQNEKLNMAFSDYYEVYENGNRAKGYPHSHLKLFKPFKSKYRLTRIINYYWQDSVFGKCNLFYSVFRKKVLDTIDINSITEGYQHLNMDNLIVFHMLQLGPIALVNEPMCTLTCGNEKFYFNKQFISKKVVNTLLNLYRSYSIDKNLYIKNTSSYIEKFLINLLFIPKFSMEIASKFLSKFIFNNSKIIIDHPVVDKMKLSNVTLVAVATQNVEATLQALIYSCREIEYNSVKLLSHFTPYCNNDIIEFIRIPKMRNIDEWSHFIVYELNKYINSDFIILIHSDGFVVNPKSWRSEFLNYDYIGAPWPLPKDNFSYRDISGKIIRVGNSVSLRSKKLLELPSKLSIPWEADHGFFNEDGFLCVKNKHILEENGANFAPLDVAKYFGHESMIPEVKNINPFTFHKWEGTNSKYPNFTKNYK